MCVISISAAAPNLAVAGWVSRLSRAGSVSASFPVVLQLPVQTNLLPRRMQRWYHRGGATFRRRMINTKPSSKGEVEGPGTVTKLCSPPENLPTLPSALESAAEISAQTTPSSVVSYLLYPFSRYSNIQRRRPYLTQFYTSLFIYAIADVTAQHFSTIPDEPYDPARTCRMVAIGGIASSPTHAWFSFLSRHFNYNSLPLSLAVKVVVQQSYFTPVFNTYFFGMQALLEGRSWHESWERITKTVPESIRNSLKVWPAVTALNFWLVEARFRMLVAGVVAVGWQGYLSWVNQREVRECRRGDMKENTEAAATAAARSESPRRLVAGANVKSADTTGKRKARTKHSKRKARESRVYREYDIKKQDTDILPYFRRT